MDIVVGDVLLRAAVEGVIPHIPGGRATEILARDLVLPLARGAFNWLKERTVNERRAALEGLAGLSTASARGTVQSVLGEHGVELSGAASLVSFLSILPMTTKQALVRHDDKGAVTALLSNLPNSAEDFLRYVPLRPPLFEPGANLPGRDFVLEELVGQGGCGEVWRAKHPFYKDVAIKFCAAEHREALNRELQLAEILRARGPHQGIVTLLDTGLNAEQPFLQYEYVAGGNLAGWSASFEGRKPSERDVLRILLMIAEALALAHDRGVVHGDLKPSNLLLTREGRVKIADFGIGFLASDHQDSDTLRNQTQLAGACTPLYADELRRTGVRDRRVDLYALGVVAYQLLLGDVTRPLPPYWEDELRTSGVSEPTLAIVKRCVTLPSARYAQAGELHEAIHALTKPVSASQPERMGPATLIAPETTQAPNVAHHKPNLFFRLLRGWVVLSCYGIVAGFPAFVAAATLAGKVRRVDRTLIVTTAFFYAAARVLAVRGARSRTHVGWLRLRTLEYVLTACTIALLLGWIASL